MDGIVNALMSAWNHITLMRAADIVDILIMTFLIYNAIMLIRRTNSFKLAKGIAVLVVVLALASIFKLTMITFILGKAMEMGLLALVVLFQPELRRLLEKMGSGELYRQFTARGQQQTAIDAAISQIVLACSDMSASKTGALIVFERTSKLVDQLRSGTIINADVTAELLKNMFYNKAPLHDGAVIIRDGRILAAGCVLPLSKNNNLSKDLGMRHRAGIGMSEVSDAVVAIVSEETGSISVAENGMLKRHLTPATLEKLLRAELRLDDDTDTGTGITAYVRKLLKGKKNEAKSDE